MAQRASEFRGFREMKSGEGFVATETGFSVRESRFADLKQKCSSEKTIASLKRVGVRFGLSLVPVVLCSIAHRPTDEFNHVILI